MLTKDEKNHFLINSELALVHLVQTPSFGNNFKCTVSLHPLSLAWRGHCPDPFRRGGPEVRDNDQASPGSAVSVLTSGVWGLWGA